MESILKFRGKNKIQFANVPKMRGHIIENQKKAYSCRYEQVPSARKRQLKS
jgi:hypothetical protein